MAIAIHVFLHAGSYRVARVTGRGLPANPWPDPHPRLQGCRPLPLRRFDGTRSTGAVPVPSEILRVQKRPVERRAILFQVVYFMHLQLILSLSQTVGPRRVVLSPAETAGTRQVNSAPKEQIPKQYSTWLTRCHGRDGRPVDRPVPS
ncbi:hypothetical protein C8F04DRAFT_1174102 [Mycena alexandri]|uniref:Uncharacterized protein n=1 Tax=Mycena alexandri TaxID=1745969 RepID=A0AAD6TF76_9AGAR|nr:hypothetical protein C8F04DRAFT_1174102 [Mycena alexandri]